MAFAVLFVVALFIFKTTSLFENKETYQSVDQETGLMYSDVTLKDLVNQDTDGDGILDWEEGLYGLDPTKKETNPGTSDGVTINKLKGTQAESGEEVEETTPNNPQTENLTETDKFSRDLFATIASLNQNGVLDQTAIDTLSDSLVEKIRNPIVRKVFSVSDIKIIKDDSTQAVANYFNRMNGIQAKYPVEESVLDVLQKFIVDEENVDPSALAGLDSTIGQTEKIISDILKEQVPESLVALHLDLLNAGQRLLENVSDMKLFDTDPIMAMGAMSKYEENMNLFQSALVTLANAISKKLNA